MANNITGINFYTFARNIMCTGIKLPPPPPSLCNFLLTLHSLTLFPSNTRQVGYSHKTFHVMSKYGKYSSEQIYSGIYIKFWGPECAPTPHKLQVGTKVRLKATFLFWKRAWLYEAKNLASKGLYKCIYTWHLCVAIGFCSYMVEDGDP